MSTFSLVHSLQTNHNIVHLPNISTTSRPKTSLSFCRSHLSGRPPVTGGGEEKEEEENKEKKKEKRWWTSLVMSLFSETEKFGRSLKDNLSPKEKGDWKDLMLMSFSFAVYVYISQKLVCAYCAWISMIQHY